MEPVPGAVLRTRSGRTVRAPARFSPDRPKGGFEDDFDSDDYEEEYESGSDTSVTPPDDSEGDPDYAPGMKTGSDEDHGESDSDLSDTEDESVGEDSDPDE